jgi:methionyl-tRNA formyltransferase
MSDYLIFSNRGKADFTKKEDLTYERLKLLNPRYVFLPFWSWYIPSEVYSNFECIVFHCAPLPYGRGGSPLQNLILRGHTKTKITALKCSKELDAGDIYGKSGWIDISKGTADELYDKFYEIITKEMIPYIVENNPKPYPQRGKVVVFKRIKRSDFDRIWTDYEGMNE